METCCFMTQLRTEQRTISSVLVIYHALTEQIVAEDLLCARCCTRLGKRSRTGQRRSPEGASGGPSVNTRAHLVDQAGAEMQKSCTAALRRLLTPRTGSLVELGAPPSLRWVRGWPVNRVIHNRAQTFQPGPPSPPTALSSPSHMQPTTLG